MNRLTSRERLLLALFLGALFLMGSGMLISGAFQRYSRLRADLSAKRSELRSMKDLLAGSASWAGRETWLARHLPPLENPGQAGVQLLEQLKASARSCHVTLENPELGGVEAGSVFQSASVNVAARSSWEDLIRFLHTVQQPGRFIVFDEANFQVDPSNPGRMLCRFKIAQWYAR